MRKSPSSQSGTSSHARVAGDARVRHRADRVAGRDRVILGVLVVVDEHGVLAGGPSSTTPRSPPCAAPLDLARQRERRRAHGREVPPLVDADHDVHPARARGAREADQPVLAQHPSSAITATRRTWSHGAFGIGSMSTRSSSGWSRSERRTGCGFQSTLPSETAHSRCAASTGTSSSASRPDGNFRTAVCSHSGRFSGTRFWKIGFDSIPPGKRLSMHGRSRSWTSRASAHSTW